MTTLLQTTRPAYVRLEERWAEHLGQHPRQVVACSSGTAALHLAWEALNVPHPDCSVHRGITPSVALCDYTMLAGARSVTLAGLEPYLIHWNSHGTLNPYHLEDRLRGGSVGRAWGVLHVSTFGHAHSSERTGIVARQHGLRYVQDLAEAHGQMPEPTADAACWSFYQNKIVAGEEGGIVYFQYPEAAARARSLRCLGMSDQYDYRHPTPRGHNYRLANRLAEPILASIEAWPQNLERRWETYHRLTEQFPAAYRTKKPDQPWVCVLDVSGVGLEKTRYLVTQLNQRGIAARCGFVPVSRQPEYAHLRWQVAGQSTAGHLNMDGVWYLPLIDLHDDIRYQQRVRNHEIARLVEEILYPIHPADRTA